MAWRLLAVLLVLTGTAWPAPIVVKCYDGSSSALVRWRPTPRTVRLSVCDEDRHLDGRCQFRVSLGATGRQVPRVFEVTLGAGRRKRVHYVDTTAVLRCLAGPEPNPVVCQPEAPPDAVTYTCQDAVLADPAADPACDVDPACDDSCTFGFRCPPCCGCLAPCFSEPAYEVQVPVGCRSVLPACDRIEVRPALVLECQARPAGLVCPVTTTTTLPVGRCITDADCAVFPPVCQHCEFGGCEGLPTINPDGSISTVVCPIPH